MPSLRSNSLRECGLLHYLAASVLLLAASIAGAQDYTLTKLPPLSEPVAINSSGQVTGLTTQTGHDSSFFWTRAGGLQILPDLGGGATRARAMNDSGAIVGESSLANNSIHAFLWTQTAGMQDFGSPLGGNSEAIAINAAGEVTGYTNSPDGQTTHAFFWSSSTGTLDLGVTSGNSYSFANAVNGTGEVVGRQAGSAGLTAFRWTQATGVETLPDFGGHNASALAIDDNGEIAGFAAQVGCQDNAALWSPDGTIQNLGTLSGYENSVARFINSAGHITGSSRPTNCCGHERTFFWTPAGMIDIGLLPNHTNGRSIPFGFNNHDQIVGSNGATYVWSPTISLRQIAGITFKYDAFLSNVLNDAGQILGSSSGNANAVVASPTMHVTISSSQNPSQVGQEVTFTASVNSIVGPPPDGESVIFQDRGISLATVTLTNGTASLTTSSLSAGKHLITVQYAGDNNYLPNKSPKLIQIVNP
jgi:probable HAF family extracellular repeat protein